MTRQPLSPTQIDSFRSREHEALTLKPGFILYRFCRTSLNRFSDFWMDKETVKQMFQFYASLKERADARNFQVEKSTIMTTAARHTTAISENWNSLEYLHTVQVVRELPAFHGPIAEQPLYNLKKGEANPSEMVLKGLGRQYVIPLFAQLLQEKKAEEILRYVRTQEFVKFSESSWYQRLVAADYRL